MCPQCGVKMVVPPAPVRQAPAIKIEGKEDEYRAARWNAGQNSIAASPFPVERPPELFHIPCPNGHALETTPEMLGKFAMCPQCQAKFKLDRRQSIEFLAAEEERLAKRETRLEKRWLNGTIIAVVLTVLLLGLLFALAGTP